MICEVTVIPRPNKPKVLVIEDDLNMRIFLCNLLRANGFDPLDAPDRVKGFEIAQTQHPALIVLDGMLPDEQSIELYYQLKLHPEIKRLPVIMLASIDQRTFCYYSKCQQLQHPIKVPDPEAFLTQPTEAEVFLDTVNRLIKPPTQRQ